MGVAKEKAMLSKAKYSGLCVLGTEVFYVLCVAYGSLLVGKAQELHHSLFELLPGVAWGKSAEPALGCGVARSICADRGLVCRMDA